MWPSPPAPDDSGVCMSPSLSLEITAEDHATLHAALAFVDDYELSDGERLHEELLLNDQLDAVGSSSRATSESERVAPSIPQHGPPLVKSEVKPPANDATTKPKPKPTTNRSRNRQRDELLYLRAKVAEMEERLSTLRTRSDQETTDTVDGITDGSSTEQQPLQEPLAFVWEELAARQSQQRQRAEVENVKLRTMLEEQIRVAKNLERLLKKRTMSEFLIPSHAKRIRKWKASSRLDDPAVFDELTAMLSEMRDQVDVVFRDDRFACRTPALRDIQARNHDELGTFVEVFDSRVSPFAIQSISDAVWHHMAMHRLDTHGFHGHLHEISDDSFRREYGASLDMPRLKGSFRGKMVAKRFVDLDRDRVIVVWAALLDPEKIAETPMDGLLMRQKGWTIIRATPPEFALCGGHHSSHNATVTQSYHMLIPEYDQDGEEEEEANDGQDHRRKMGTLTNFVLNSVDFHMETGRQMIENLLFKAAGKTPSSLSERHNNSRE